MQRVLLGNPFNYEVTWENPAINPWMKIDKQPDRGKAIAELGKLYHLYEYLGAKIYTLPAIEGLGDQVFVANLGWGMKIEGDAENTFVMANLKPEQRRPETKIAARWFADNRFSIHFLPEDIFFEGQGDFITTEEAYIFCHGARNSLSAVDEIQKIFNLKKPIITLELIDPYFYHGDVCIRYSRYRNAILFYPGAFNRESIRKIENLKARKKDVPKKFMMQDLGEMGRNFPLNGCYIGKYETFPWNIDVEEFPPDLRNWIELDGGEVITLDFSQFGLSGAGHRCVTLFLD